MANAECKPSGQDDTIANNDSATNFSWFSIRCGGECSANLCWSLKCRKNYIPKWMVDEWCYWHREHTLTGRHSHTHTHTRPHPYASWSTMKTLDTFFRGASKNSALFRQTCFSTHTKRTHNQPSSGPLFLANAMRHASHPNKECDEHCFSWDLTVGYLVAHALNMRLHSECNREPAAVYFEKLQTQHWKWK